MVVAGGVVGVCTEQNKYLLFVLSLANEDAHPLVSLHPSLAHLFSKERKIRQWR